MAMCKNQNAIRVYKNSFSSKESQLYEDNRYKMWYSPEIWHYVINYMHHALCSGYCHHKQMTCTSITYYH